MLKIQLVSFYLVFLCFYAAKNSFDFWRNEQLAWAMVGVVAFIFFLLSTIGYHKNITSLLWVTQLSLIAFTLFLVGALVWSFFVGEVLLLLVVVVAIVGFINMKVILHVNRQMEI